MMKLIMKVNTGDYVSYHVKSAYPQNQSVHQLVNTCPFKCRPPTVLHQFGLQPCWRETAISVERTQNREKRGKGLYGCGEGKHQK